MKFFYLLFFGSVGLSTRYLFSLYIPKLAGLPVPTLVCNLLGCFFIGFLFKNPFHFSQDIKFALIVGLCGCLTTFSSYIFEIMNLWSQSAQQALIYLTLSLIMGSIMISIGSKSASSFLLP